MIFEHQEGDYDAFDEHIFLNVSVTLFEVETAIVDRWASSVN